MEERMITIPFGEYAALCNLVSSAQSVARHMRDLEDKMTITAPLSKISHMQGCLSRVRSLAARLHAHGHHIEGTGNEAMERVNAVTEWEQG